MPDVYGKDLSKEGAQRLRDLSSALNSCVAELEEANNNLLSSIASLDLRDFQGPIEDETGQIVHNVNGLMDALLILCSGLNDLAAKIDRIIITF